MHHRVPRWELAAWSDLIQILPMSWKMHVEALTSNVVVVAVRNITADFCEHFLSARFHWRWWWPWLSASDDDESGPHDLKHRLSLWYQLSLACDTFRFYQTSSSHMHFLDDFRGLHNILLILIGIHAACHLTVAHCSFYVSDRTRWQDGYIRVTLTHIQAVSCEGLEFVSHSSGRFCWKFDTPKIYSL